MEKEVFIYHSQNDDFMRVRATVVGKFSDGVLNIAVSRCSEKDMFCRKTGRELAIERLNKGEFYATVKTDDASLIKFLELARVVAEAVVIFGTKQKIEIVEETQYFYKLV